MAPCVRIARASTRASRIPWDAPFEPIGYIACAASPSSVTGPKLQRGSGSRSTIGYSKQPSAPRISPGTSSQSNRQSANWGRKSLSTPGRFQSSRRQPWSGANLRSAIQLTIAAPPSAARREIG